MSQTIEVKVPDIGDFKDVPVIDVLVKPGDAIKAEQPLITLESDKATMDVPSPASGTVKEIKIHIGDKVSEGALVLLMESADAAPTPPASEKAPTPPPPAATNSRGGIAEVRVPDIGDFKEVPIIEILVKAGDEVKAEQPLITLESDKATMDVPSPLGGVVGEIKVKVGDKVSEGSVILSLVTGDTSAPPPPSAAPSTSAAPPPAQAALTAPSAGVDEGAFKLAYAGPGARKLARELGVDLGKVKGSGNNGRILKEDVESFAKGGGAAQAKAPAAAADGAGLGLLPWPQVDFAKFGPVESKPLSRIQKISGANLHRNWVMIPAVTYHEDADISELEAFRVQINKEGEKSGGTKLTMLAFLIKACVRALQQFPSFNTSLDGENLIYKQYYHIAFAADTPNGLVVPVVKDADKKGVFDIAAETGALAKKAREGKLGPADMQGACFTISSLGGIGGTYFSPIINAPEVAILGVNKSITKPVWDGKQFAPKLILPLSLSADHRVIDGALATRFNVYLAQLLADFRRVLL
ncbi:MAG: dihydrolipoyllysine-residue acetyltransferase [Candidatus Competibacteraceae bacterium]|nr:dihydrolipoyllysine-residue acetyltransferase [Candidatus Competibacteraceae bacterium]